MAVPLLFFVVWGRHIRRVSDHCGHVIRLRRTFRYPFNAGFWIMLIFQTKQCRTTSTLIFMALALAIPVTSVYSDAEPLTPSVIAQHVCTSTRARGYCFLVKRQAVPSFRAMFSNTGMSDILSPRARHVTYFQWAPFCEACCPLLGA